MKNKRFWGVIVKPGETVTCDPGESSYHISQISLQAGALNQKEDVVVFVYVGPIRFNICTLSVYNCPQIITDLVFNEEFELGHSSNVSDISILGYQFETVERCNSATKKDDKSKETTHITNELSAPRPTDVPSSKSKVVVEDTDSSGNPKGDDKKAKDRSRPVETSLMTPPGKCTDIATPSMGKQTDSSAGKRSGYVHVDTPHPAKRTKTSPDSDESKQSTSNVNVATPLPLKQANELASSDKSKQSTGDANVATPPSETGKDTSKERQV